MPRKTPAAPSKSRKIKRFNEAGAECPGKLALRAGDQERDAASMRPGLNAPENGHVAGGRRGQVVVASMRPGLNAPENSA